MAYIQAGFAASGRTGSASVKRLPLTDRRVFRAHSIADPQPSRQAQLNRSSISDAPVAALDIHGNRVDNSAPSPSQPEGTYPHFPHELSLDVTRRSALVAACGAASLGWLKIFPQSVTDHRAIEKVVVNMPFEEARNLCAEASGVCSTLYSQMSSTLRQLSTGFIPDEMFQAACQRRLSSPYIQESMISLEECLPVIGVELAYSPDLSGTGWLLAASGHPRLDPAQRERIEGMTLRGLQRCRRVQRLSVAMSARRYTPAAVQLLTQDLRELSKILEEMIAEADRRQLAKAQ